MPLTELLSGFTRSTRGAPPWLHCSDAVGCTGKRKEKGEGKKKKKKVAPVLLSSRLQPQQASHKPSHRTLKRLSGLLYPFICVKEVWGAAAACIVRKGRRWATSTPAENGRLLLRAAKGQGGDHFGDSASTLPPLALLLCSRALPLRASLLPSPPLHRTAPHFRAAGPGQWRQNHADAHHSRRH